MQVKQSLGYGCDPQKYMFGMCEEFEGSLDKGADPMVTIDLIDRLGAKSMRIWMHHKRLLRRKGDTDELEWKPDVFARYRKYVEELARRGIRIVAMNHNYVFPKSFSGDPVSVPEMPLPGTQAYSDEMNMISAAYEMMAREFPEIEYWECGNEVNMNSYLAKPGFSASGVKNAEYDSEFTYTNTEKAEITADICYYSSLGVKRGNPKAYVVFPAPTPYRGYAEMCEFYEAVYRAIGSGRFPRGLPADTDPDNYRRTSVRTGVFDCLLHILDGKIRIFLKSVHDCIRQTADRNISPHTHRLAFWHLSFTDFFLKFWWSMPRMLYISPLYTTRYSSGITSDTALHHRTEKSALVLSTTIPAEVLSFGDSPLMLA